MSSKTLVLKARAGRVRGAVVESSIGSMGVSRAFESVDGSLPVAGPFDRVLATVPATSVAFRILELPFRDRRRAALAVGPALEEHVPFSLDEGRLAWDFTGQASGSRVLAGLVESERLDEVRAAVTDLAGTPQRLLWTPCATLAAYRRAVAGDFAVVDLGEDGATVARFEDGELVALRLVAPCADDLLLRNTAWSLSTVAGPGARAVLGGAFASRLGARLAAAAPHCAFEPLPAACPVAGLGDGDWRLDPALAGLVLVATGEAAGPVLDFEGAAGSFLGLGALGEMRGELRPLARWAAAAAALGLLAVGLDYAELLAQRGALASRADEIYASVMPSPSGGTGRKLKMDMRLRELAGRAQASSSAGASGSPLALLAALSRETPKSLEVTVDQVEHLPPAAKVSGHAASFESVTKMQQSLEKSGAFSRVEVKDVHASVSGSGVEFLLELVPAQPGSGA